MKTRIINWMMLMMVMFITSACNNKDDFSDIMDSNNLLTENIEIFEIEEVNTRVECPDEDHTTSLFYCFENKSELNGLYTIDDMDLLNWNNRTLVVVHAFYHSLFYDFSKKVYKKDGEYVIELLETNGDGFRNLAYDHKCFGIQLDKSNVIKEDILLKVGIYIPAGTDSEGNRHEEHYEYLK